MGEKGILRHGGIKEEPKTPRPEKPPQGQCGDKGEKLKACPFCGARCEEHPHEKYRDEWYIIHHEEGCFLHILIAGVGALAQIGSDYLEAWDRRTPPDKDMPIVILPKSEDGGEERRPCRFRLRGCYAPVGIEHIITEDVRLVPKSVAEKDCVEIKCCANCGRDTDSCIKSFDCTDAPFPIHWIPKPTAQEDEGEKYCNECEFLTLKEYDQSDKRQAHRCDATGCLIKHEGQHPRLPRIPACPFNRCPDCASLQAALDEKDKQIQALRSEIITWESAYDAMGDERNVAEKKCAEAEMVAKENAHGLTKAVEKITKKDKEIKRLNRSLKILCDKNKVLADERDEAGERVEELKGQVRWCYRRGRKLEAELKSAEAVVKVARESRRMLNRSWDTIEYAIRKQIPTSQLKDLKILLGNTIVMVEAALSAHDKEGKK